jgi:hypothetical protein
MDYLVSMILIFSPWIFNFSQAGPQTWVPVSFGAAAIIYSLITNYELGALRILSMRAHLTFDIIAGILLAASPWIFNFHEEIFLPHLILGIISIVVPLITDPVSRQKHTDISEQHAH